MNTMEEYEIYKAVKKEPHNVLNEQRGFKSNIIYESAIRIGESQPKQWSNRDKEGEGGGGSTLQDNASV